MIPPADRYQFQVELYCGKSRKEAEAWSTLRFEAASFSDAEEQAIRYFACDWHVTEIRKLHKVVDGKWEDD